jgi:prepilin-type N-terminal cleavage/methylation domain-containing protein
MNQLNPKLNGFTLVELLVVVTILSLVTSWSAPSFLRKVWQGEVDRYTQTVEAGMLKLMRKLGTTRSSCTLTFPVSKSFQPTWNILEFQQPNGSSATNTRMECCNSDFATANLDEGCLNNLDPLFPPTFRLIQREGSSDRTNVEVAVSQSSYSLTPPGTSAETGTLTFRIRSLKQMDPAMLKGDGSNRLVERCIEISGTGNLMRGKWLNNQCIEEKLIEIT